MYKLIIEADQIDVGENRILKSRIIPTQYQEWRTNTRVKETCGKSSPCTGQMRTTHTMNVSRQQKIWDLEDRQLEMKEQETNMPSRISSRCSVQTTNRCKA